MALEQQRRARGSAQTMATTTIRIPADLLKSARDAGINLSMFVEAKLASEVSETDLTERINRARGEYDKLIQAKELNDARNVAISDATLYIHRIMAQGWDECRNMSPAEWSQTYASCCHLIYQYVAARPLLVGTGWYRKLDTMCGGVWKQTAKDKGVQL